MFNLIGGTWKNSRTLQIFINSSFLKQVLMLAEIWQRKFLTGTTSIDTLATGLMNYAFVRRASVGMCGDAFNDLGNQLSRSHVASYAINRYLGCAKGALVYYFSSTRLLSQALPKECAETGVIAS
jgi:hypothetical protein